MASPIADTLLADAPRGTELDLFGRFVGSWTFEGTEFGVDGAETPRRGRWDFGYVLGGTAIQDVLRYEGGHCGTTIRFPRDDGTWEVVWISGARRAVHLTARPEDQRILLTGGDGNRQVRWSFNDITTDGFLWRGEELTDDRARFRLAEEIHLRRIA
jgi:hypothetical protein